MGKTKLVIDLNNPDDRNGEKDKDGYTNLEEYLNSLITMLDMNLKE